MEHPTLPSPRDVARFLRSPRRSMLPRPALPHYLRRCVLVIARFRRSPRPSTLRSLASLPLFIFAACAYQRSLPPLDAPLDAPLPRSTLPDYLRRADRRKEITGRTDQSVP